MNNQYKNSKEGTIESLFAENRFCDAYKKSFRIGVHKRILLYPLLLSLPFLLIVFWLSPSELFNLTKVFSNIGIAFSAGAIGLALAAFSLFASVMGAKQRITLASILDEKSQISMLKANMLPFIQFCAHFITFFILSAFMGTFGPMEESVKRVYLSIPVNYRWIPEEIAAIGLWIFFTAMMFVAIQIKSLCWNIYTASMASTVMLWHQSDNEVITEQSKTVSKNDCR